MNDRAYPTRPVCGVGVVAFNGHQVLLIRRGKEPRLGEWSIPGGKIELGESVREAAVREFAEECGGKVDLRDIVDVVDIIRPDAAGRVEYHFVVIDFWGEWEGGKLAASSDVLEARWVNAVDLDDYALPLATRVVIDKARLARAKG